MPGSEKRVEAREVQFRVTPFDAAEAQDFYANLTGVGNSVAEMVLVFAQAYPEPKLSEGEPIRVAPKVRVTLPVEAARNLLRQLTDQLGVREAIDEQVAEEGTRGANGEDGGVGQ
jgi:hypothetical protein